MSDGDGGNATAITKTVSVTGDATLVVTTTNFVADGNTASVDALLANRGADGQISMQEAIDATNNTVGLNRIHFDISAPLVSGVHTFAIGVVLPAVDDPLIIDGTTEPDYAGTPIIEFDGSALPLAGSQTGFRLVGGSDGSTIRGTIISGFGDDGIMLFDSSNNQIAGNYIGFDISGTAIRSNAQDGIVIGGVSTNNTIGGLGASDGNVISGNGLAGINIYDGNSGSTTIQGNIIGLNAAGSAALGNSNQGILLSGGTNNNVIGGTTVSARNVITGNGTRGIEVSGSFNTTIQGNYVGTDITGTLDVDGITADGSKSGIYVSNGSAGTVIGGVSAGAGNLISGNNWYGIEIVSNSTRATTVQGNLIGTDATGTLPLGNAQGGISLFQDVYNNQIGGSSNPLSRNIIAGNQGVGIRFGETTTGGNRVLGNNIGVDINGNPLGNTSHGVEIVSNSANNVIGGTSPGAGNWIANNAFQGVLLTATAGNGNNILGNTIEANGGLAIDIGNNGPETNDPLDTDVGANELQNHPILVSAGVTGSSTLIRGTFNSAATRSYRIEFYSAAGSGDPQGSGEGEVFLGFTTVTTDGSGDATIDVTLPLATTAGDSVTATATDITDLGQVGIDDGLAYGSTSEFSPNIAIQDTPPVIDLDADDSSGSTGLNYNTTFTEGGGPTSIVDADAIVQDVSSANLTLLNVSITNFLDPLDESLNADATGTSIIVNFNSGTGVLSLSGTDTVANYQQVLRTVTYNNTSENPDATARVISFSATDGVNNSLTANTTLTINAVNDPPALSNAPVTLSYTEGNAPVGDASLVLTDVDNPTMTGASVVISNNFVTGQDELTFSPFAGITGVWNALAGTMTLSGSSTVANYEAAMRSVSYQNTSDAPDTSTRTLTYVVNDGASDSNSLDKDVLLYAANDAPVNSTPLVVTVTEQTATAITTISTSDIDAAIANMTTQLQVSAGILNVTASGSAIISAGSNGSADLIILGNQTDINATLATLTYTGNVGTIGTNADTLVVTTSDLGNTGNGGTQQDVDSIQVDVQNVALLTITAPVAPTTTEDNALLFSGANIISVDDNITADTRLQVTVSVNNGTITLAGTAGLSIPGGINGSSSMVIHGLESDINAALNGLQYTPTANYNGPATLNITVSLEADQQGLYTFETLDGTDTSVGLLQNGSLVGDNASAGFDPVRGSNVLSLDGDRDYMQISGMFGNPTDVTVAAWIEPSGSSEQEIISLGDNLALRINPSGEVAGFFYDSVGINAINTGAIVGSGWHHVAATYSSTDNQLRVYLDGNEVGTASGGAIAYNIGTDTFVGAHGFNQTNFDYGGLIDDARIYTPRTERG